jgi:cobalamin biosynthesis protein CbiD
MSVLTAGIFAAWSKEDFQSSRKMQTARCSTQKCFIFCFFNQNVNGAISDSAMTKEGKGVAANSGCLKR